jgi:hypothetical protein
VDGNGDVTWRRKMGTQMGIGKEGWGWGWELQRRDADVDEREG